MRVLGSEETGRLSDNGAIPGTKPNGTADAELNAPAFTDEALALRFAARHAENLRYVAEWGRWYRHNGKVWVPDKTLSAFDDARKICREAAGECNSKKAAALASAKTVAAVSMLARADRRLAATADQWDTDPWLLNTPSSVIDLRSGKSRPHCATDHLSKITAIAPNPTCQIVQWLSFLDRITGGDTELIAYLQRMAGYALTGLTTEHAFFFLYGTGTNGKSTFLDALVACAGNYHRTAQIDIFIDSRTERHPTDLAALHGARVVTATETEEGRRWAESKIKVLTGGDKISARFMRQDFFEFTPQFKLIIAGNHKPSLRSVDEAIRRRFHLVPFAVTIPKAERDLQLSEKLKAELPGILQWMIEGCLKWQRAKLSPPNAVTTATDKYLSAEDSIGEWINEFCNQDASAWESTASLFASWKGWAERAGEHPGTQKRFTTLLEGRGFEYHRKTHGRGFSGLSLGGHE